MNNITRFLSQYIPNIPQFSYPWELLEFFKNNQEWGADFTKHYGKWATVGDLKISMGENVEIQPYVTLSGLIIMGKNCRVGPYSILRGVVLLGDNVSIGPHCEICRSVLMNNVFLGHKNIVLDSILCDKVKLAAHVCTSNVPVGKEYITACYDGKRLPYKGKYGAMVDHDCWLGTNTCTMPGTYIKPHTEYIGHTIICGMGKEKPFYR